MKEGVGAGEERTWTSNTDRRRCSSNVDQALQRLDDKLTVLGQFVINYAFNSTRRHDIQSSKGCLYRWRTTHTVSKLSSTFHISNPLIGIRSSLERASWALGTKMVS